MVYSGLRKTGLACAVAALTFAMPAWAADVTIDVVLPLTGNASFLGQGLQRVLQALEGVVNKDGGINGAPLRFVFRDDQTSPQVAVQLTNAVIAAKRPVIMGSGLVAMCNAMAPLIRNGPFDYCLSPATQPAAGSYMYSTNVSTRDLLRADFSYFRSRGWTKVATISSSDATGQDFDKGIDIASQLPENAGITLVQRAKFNQSDVSVAAQMEQIKAARPQVVIVWTTGAAIATLFKGVVQSGIEVPIVTTNGNQTFEQMDQYATFLPKELYFATSLAGGTAGENPRSAAAQATFKAALTDAKVPLDINASHAWDPGMMVVNALRKLGPDATAAQIKAYFDELTDFAGVNGIYDFKKYPQRGLDVASAVVTRWTPATRQWVAVSKPGGEALQP